tara:strand:+ start:56 stop:244 length:189 start_codon:yes stop_codon:yes gene_type:complete
MSRSNHYSLAAPTSLLLDDDHIIERVFSHIDNKTTDLVFSFPFIGFISSNLKIQDQIDKMNS